MNCITATESATVTFLSQFASPASVTSFAPSIFILTLTFSLTPLYERSVYSG